MPFSPQAQLKFMNKITTTWHLPYNFLKIKNKDWNILPFDFIILYICYLENIHFLSLDSFYVSASQFVNMAKNLLGRVSGISTLES